MADGSSINILFLVELVVVVIVTSAFLFYWNRLFAWATCLLVRLYTWRRYHAYISIGSLQISPLAGRIAWRDLEYHSSNLSFRSLNGHVTYRYWKLRVRQEQDSQSTNPKRNRLPCRISIYAEGLEGYVYNRTPAYDNIVERLREGEKARAKANGNDPSDAQKPFVVPNDKLGFGFGARLRRNFTPNTGEKKDASSDQQSSASDEPPQKSSEATGLADLREVTTPPPKDGVDWFRELVPIEIRLAKGAMTLGSDATPMLLIADFQSGEGTLEVMDSRSPCDEYKMTVDLRFEKTEVLMRTNVDYSGPLLAHGRKIFEMLNRQYPEVKHQPKSALSSFFNFHALSRIHPFLHDPKFSSPPVAGLEHDKVWKGLARYRQEDTSAPSSHKREEWEYAKVTTLLRATALDVTYYADSPGIVPDPSTVDIIDYNDDYGNISPPPEYGVDVVLHGGEINYGPWADRQRDALQKTFAPAFFFHSEPKPRLKVGDRRIHSMLVINISLPSDRTTLRIPTREPSKDWRYDGTLVDSDRPYGWLDVTVGEDTSVIYKQSQFATARGYDASLDLHIASLQIASSVNYQTFITSKTCQVSMTMPTPLRWDAQRSWGLDISLDRPDVTLLRDHVQLISDLARDWSSGAQGDFHHFVPNHYDFRVSLRDYAFHLYINDNNIVNYPLSRADNAFLDVYGPTMTSYIAVAATEYRPEFSTVPFSVETKDVRVELCLPVWDTHRTFTPGGTLEIGKIGKLEAKGNYRYYATPKPGQQEALTLHLGASKVIYKMLGWTLRRLFCVKDNYFGIFTQFTTMNEYLERFDHDPNSVGDPVEEKYRPGRSDPFSVQVTMDVHDSLILLSDEIYRCDSGLALPVPQMQMALRSTETFLDLSLDALPTYVVPVKEMDMAYGSATAPRPSPKDVIFLEGIQLKAHRLFGPQPRATTYMCIWELSVPRITAYVSPEMESTLQSFREAVIYNYQDFDNAPADIYLPQVPPDVTFFKMEVRHFSMTLATDQAALTVDLPKGINLDTSTWATQNFRSAIGVVIPAITAQMLRKVDQWRNVANIQTDLSLQIFNAPPQWRLRASDQQKFLAEQDGATQRVRFLYSDHPDGLAHVHGVAVIADEDDGSLDSDLEDFDISSDDDLDTELPIDGSDAESLSDSRAATTAPRRRVTRSVFRQRDGLLAVSATEMDESDTSSTQTSSLITDAGSKRPHDMPNALMLGLERLKMFHSSLPKGDLRKDHAAKSGDDPQSSLPRLEALDGRIVRLRLSELNIEGSMEAIDPGTILIQSLRCLDGASPDRLLDDLLLWQIAPIFQLVGEKVRVVIDAEIARSDLRFRCPLGESSSSAIDIKLLDHSINVVKNLEHEGTKASINVINSTQRLQLAVTTDRGGQELYLQDQHPIPTLLPYKVVDLLVKEAEICLSPATPDIILRYRLGHAETHFVSSAISTLQDTVNAMTMAVQKSRATSSMPYQYLSLLYRICLTAEAAGVAPSAPPVLTQSRYGLHMQDQRSFREDLGWKLLARLRYWLHQSALQEPKMPSAEEMAKAVLSNLALYEDSVGNSVSLLLQQDFIKHAIGNALGSLRHMDPDQQTRHTDLCGFLGRLEIHHHGHLLGSRTRQVSSVKASSANLGLRHTVSFHTERPTTKIQQLVAVQALDVALQNSILPLLDVIPVFKQPEETTTASKNVANLLFDVQLGSMSLQAEAAGLKARLEVEGMDVAMVRHFGVHDLASTGRGPTEQFFLTTTGKEIRLELLQARDVQAQLGPAEDRMVISSAVTDVRTVISRHRGADPSQPKIMRMLLGSKTFSVDSRPQLKVFVNFVRQWKGQHSNVYEPYLKLLSPKRSHDSMKAPPAPSISPLRRIHLDLSFESGTIQLRAAKAVWIRWELGSIFASQQCSGTNWTFGVKIAPQFIGAYTSWKQSRQSSGASIRLPSVAGNGSLADVGPDRCLSVDIKLGFFTGIMKPAMLDRLLSLHQRLGTDVSELINDYRQNSTKSPPSEKKPSSPSKLSLPASERPMRQRIRAHITGVRVGLRADDVATTLLFEALSLTGQASNVGGNLDALRWEASVDHVGLSLGQLDTELSIDLEPIRKNRSAYMVFDVTAREKPAVEADAARLEVMLNHVHTVMHIAALSELSDLVRSWQSDIHILQSNRAAEMAEVRATTTRIFKQLEAEPVANQPVTSWFATRLLFVTVTGFGMAIPLNDGAAIDLEHRDNSAMPALLLAVKSVHFQNRKNETARFALEQMVLQLVDRFDQGIPDHFKGDYHTASNRMSLPLLDTEAQMASTPEFWTLSAHGSATDFKLSLAPDIADGVFKLIDLYEKGQQRVYELEQRYRAEIAKASASDSVALKYEGETSRVSPRQAQRIIMRMSYTFNSGLVEMHHTAAPEPLSAQGMRPRRTAWLDFFQLPAISLWIDYVGQQSWPQVSRQSSTAEGFTSASMAVANPRVQPGSLIFNFAVHESRNTLRPSILPFFVDLVRRIETRLRRNPNEEVASASETKPSSPSPPEHQGPEPSILDLRADALNKQLINVRLTLRIDRSELRFSCLPDSNAYFDLKWESGGFVASTTLGEDGVSTVAGSISDITSSLSHEFADKNRDCIQASAKDMAFSVVYRPAQGDDQAGVSVVFDTQVSGLFRLDQYSAWLIFTSVWMGNAPKLDLPPPRATAVSDIPLAQANNSPSMRRHPKVALAVLARFRSIDFDAHLGVSQTHLEITPIQFRSVADGEKTEIDVQIGTTQVSARGDVAGEMRSESLSFNTMRRSSRASSKSRTTVLSMAIEGGDLTGSLFLADTNILRFHLEPTRVTLADDWRAHAHDPKAQVSLAFAIKAGMFRGVLRLLTIPRLLGNLYTIIDMAEYQSTIAARRSEIFKAERIRERDEPSPMAAIILRSAQKASGTGEAAPVRTAQTMRFDLAGIDVGLFNEDNESDQLAEFYRFVIGKFEADLKRKLTPDDLPNRDLSLLVSFVRWDSSDGAKVAALEEKNMGAGQVIDLAVRVGRSEVVSLPVMTLLMDSIEYHDPPILDLDFDLSWGETDGDIKVLPNFFEQAYTAFRKLIKGLDEQEMARSRRMESVPQYSLRRKAQKPSDEVEAPVKELVYRHRDPRKADRIPVPKLRMLGEGTGDMAKLVPRVRSGFRELPNFSHRFVVLPLENGMDLLLKLYEKQLPSGVGRDTEAAS